MPTFSKNKGFNMGNKGNFNFGKTMDLNADRYGPSASAEQKAAKKKKKKKQGPYGSWEIKLNEHIK